MVFLMVVIGGATRLTGSGLSIVEWEPVRGVAPPTSETEWQVYFKKYQATQQYRRVNYGMTLEGFKEIFWLEYFHRLLGRLLGAVFLLPFLYFLFRKKLTPKLSKGLAAIFLLGAAQGFMGWYMVKSGLANTTSVSQYRLAAHLSLAFCIMGAIMWTALDLRQTKATANDYTSKSFRFSLLATLMIFFMVFLGALVAGTAAGFSYNTFPLMDGKWVPDGLFSMKPWQVNLFENTITIQFAHRLMALIITISVVLLIMHIFRTNQATIAKKAAITLGLAVALQIGLGIATLLLVVPVPLAALHQAGAVLLFSSSLFLNHCLFTAKPAQVNIR